MSHRRASSRRRHTCKSCGKIVRLSHTGMIPKHEPPRKQILLEMPKTGEWRKMMEDEIKEWLANPFRIPIMPVPVTVTVVPGKYPFCKHSGEYPRISENRFIYWKGNNEQSSEEREAEGEGSAGGPHEAGRWTHGDRY